MLTILGVCSPLQLEKVSARKRRRTPSANFQSTADDPCRGLGMPASAPTGRAGSCAQASREAVTGKTGAPAIKAGTHDQQVSRLTFTFVRKHKATVPVASWTLRDCNWDWTGLSAVVNLEAFNSSQ
jgi:hypothetical protein